MLDIFSLLTFVGVAVGLVVADSILIADTVQVRVAVHPDAAAGGFTRELTEDFLSHEFRRIFAPQSALRMPRLRVTADQSFVTTLSKAAGVDDLRFALQDIMRLDPMRIGVVIGATNERRRPGVVVFGSRSSGGFFQIELPAADAGPPATLRAAAIAAALQIDAYHGRLHQARRLTDETEAALGLPPPVAGPATEAYLGRYAEAYERRLRALGDEIEAGIARSRLFPGVDDAALSNLVGVVRFRLGETAAAEAAFRRALDLAPELQVPQLNLALLQILAGHATDGLRRARDVEAFLTRDRTLERDLRLALRASTAGTIGTALLVLGDPEEAARQWDEACTRVPQLGVVALWYEVPWLPAPRAQRCFPPDQTAASRAAALRAIEKLGWEALLLGPAPGAAAAP